MIPPDKEDDPPEKPNAESDPWLAIREMLHKGRYGDAHEALQKSNNQYQKDKEFHLLHGLALVGLDRDDEAKAALRRAVAMDPKYDEPHIELGIIAYKRCKRALMAEEPDLKAAREELRKAAAAFEKALECNPTRDESAYYCGMAHFKLWQLDKRDDKQLDQAYQRLQEAARQDSSSDNTAGGIQWYLARIAEHHGDVDRAIAHWERAAKYFADEPSRGRQALDAVKRLKQAANENGTE